MISHYFLPATRKLRPSGSEDVAHLFYQISDNGNWSAPIEIPNTANGFDPTVAQHPITGKITVAYADYVRRNIDRYWHSSIRIVDTDPGNLLQGIWNSPKTVVNSPYEDDLVPTIYYFTDSNNNVKLQIVYSHGREPGNMRDTTMCIEGEEPCSYSQLRMVESTDGGNSWSDMGLVYDSPDPDYYDSKASCTQYGNAVICAFYVRDTNTDNSGIFTILSLGGAWSHLNELLPISPEQHKWPFIVRGGSEYLLAYTTLGASQNEFMIKIKRSAYGYYGWHPPETISARAGISETWPTIAKRYAYNGLSGLTAAWDNAGWDHRYEPPFEFYYSNFRGLYITSPINQGGPWYANYYGTPVYNSIVWKNHFTAANAVDISIHRGTGYYWEPIALSAPNTGSYSWLTTTPECTNCRMRIYDGTYSHISYFTLVDEYIG